MLLDSLSVKFSAKMRSKTKKITERLQDLSETSEGSSNKVSYQRSPTTLDLSETSEGRSNKVRYQRLPTTSLNETHVYGREKDQEAILDLLLKEEGNEDGISVIPIVTPQLESIPLLKYLHEDAEQLA